MTLPLQQSEAKGERGKKHDRGRSVREQISPRNSVRYHFVGEKVRATRIWELEAAIHGEYLVEQELVSHLASSRCSGTLVNLDRVGSLV